MKNKSTIFMLILLMIIKGLELFKCTYFEVNFSFIRFILETVCILVLFVIGNIKIKKGSFPLKLYNSVLIISSLLSLIFYSFNSLGMIMLYGFVFLISSFTMIKTKFRFEISLVLSVTILLLAYTLIGIVGLLKYSYIFLLLLVGFIVWYFYSHKELVLKEIKSIDKKSLIILSILILVASLAGVGRYVHKWDEYSHWGYAAKVTIDTSSLKSLISYTGDTSNYPPIASLWHYFVSQFLGYSEPNLYIGLTILDFIFMLPVFMKLSKKKILSCILMVIATVVFPYLFNGSITYELLYVDLLLGIMCSSVLIFNDYLKEHKFSRIPIYLLLAVITLLKANGFIYSCCLLFLFYLQDLCERRKVNFVSLLNVTKRYILPLVYVMGIFVAWNIIAKNLKNVNFSYNC